MGDKRRCPECGAEIPATAPMGFCEPCLLKVAMATKATEPARDNSQRSTIALSPPTENPGDHIGRYKLLEKIGEGGMGTVHVALQEEPVRRKVALKIIKLGMDTREVVARFEAERQALALMDHPNIAKVLDAGATETGRPFFVMEWVQGDRITDYCDRQNLSTRSRLDLFIQICGAIQHAHQKGIIHRDIKPSNILVTLQEDGTPAIKVIDFGIAKATAGQTLTDKTLFTALEQFLGTPAYMSPEQAETTGLDIDTRSDIYSLGVLLYELLTGKTPFDAQRLLAAGLDGIRRIIREEEPLRPSTRISTLGATERTTVAKRRQCEAPRLIHLVRGDLDWIVMKCLEKDRTRRYETANGLATDIQRHLKDEPVLAGPPTARYRAAKFVRKHRTGVAVSAGFAGTLLLATAFSAALAIRTHRALLRAEKAERMAKENAQVAEGVTSFLKDNVLAAARPEGQDGGLGRNVTMRQAVIAAEPQVAAHFANQPLVEAEIRNTLGATFDYLGEVTNEVIQYEQAYTLRKGKLGADDPLTLSSFGNLAGAYYDAGRLSEATAMLEQVFRLQRAKLGPEHRDTLVSMKNLAVAHSTAGRTKEALAMLEETLGLMKANLGLKDQDTLGCMQSLATTYGQAGRESEALALSEELVRLRKIANGPTHPLTLTVMRNLGTDYQKGGRLLEALKLYEEVLKAQKASLGSEHPETIWTSFCTGQVLWQEGKPTEAVPIFEEALKSLESKFPPDHPRALRIRRNLAWAYRDAGRLNEAQPLAAKTLELHLTKWGPDHPETLGAMEDLAEIKQRVNDLNEAGKLYEKALAIRQKQAPDKWQTFRTRSALGGVLLDQKKWTEAEPLLVLGFAGLKQHQNDIPPRQKAEPSKAAQRLVQLYQATGQTDKAAGYQKELEALKAKVSAEAALPLPQPTK